MIEEKREQTVLSDLQRSLQGRVEGYEPHIARLKELIQGRDSDGGMLAKIHGKSYELLLEGLEADLFYLMAKERRREAAQRFWKSLGNMDGDPQKTVVDFAGLCVRASCCPACVEFWRGVTFETAEYVPEIEIHTLDLD